MKKKLCYLLFGACAVYGAFELLGLLITYLFLYSHALGSVSAMEASSIGIIGGADGPTSVFVTTASQGSYLLPVLLLILGVGGILWLRRKK